MIQFMFVRIIARRKKEELENLIDGFPAVVMLGQRQVGKTTLADEVGRARDADYLNLRDPFTGRMIDKKGLRAHVAETGKALTILDEIQSRKDLFAELMAVIDERRRRGDAESCFLLLGSGSLEISNKSRETLLGRVEYLDLSPLDVTEVEAPEEIDKLWLRGGLPGVFTARDDKTAFRSLRAIARNLSMQDLPEEGAGGVAPSKIYDILIMLAESHGGPVNVLRMANALELSRDFVSNCVALLESLRIIRRLWPYGRSRVRNLVKSPRIYFQDSGLLHQLRGVASIPGMDENLTGASWEGFVIENILRQIDDPVNASYYRTKKGVEVDLIINSQRSGTWAIEIKKGSPDNSHGFHKAVLDIKPKRSFVVHGRFDLPRQRNAQGVEKLSLLDMCKEVASHFS